MGERLGGKVAIVMLAANAKGVFLGTKHAIPAMRRSGAAGSST